MLAAVVALTGCLSPAPEPTPTPTAVFSSEEEAFAAAEETYRAYVDAVNARRADPQSEPDPQSFLIGEALEADIDSLREFEELGIRIHGDSLIGSVVPASADVTTGDVALQVCYDSTGARIIDESGDDVTLADRDPTILLDVRFVAVDGDLLVESLSAVDGGSC